MHQIDSQTPLCLRQSLSFISVMKYQQLYILLFCKGLLFTKVFKWESEKQREKENNEDVKLISLWKNLVFFTYFRQQIFSSKTTYWFHIEAYLSWKRLDEKYFIQLFCPDAQTPFWFNFYQKNAEQHTLSFALNCWKRMQKFSEKHLSTRLLKSSTIYNLF